VDIPASHRDALRAGGIIVEPFRPIRLSTLHLAQNRSHVRGIVIDSRIGWTGGFGIDDKWFATDARMAHMRKRSRSPPFGNGRGFSG
jgi:cardiolipin synthase A/B